MSQPNRSLQEKSSARLAAAQLLYQAAVTGEEPQAAKMLASYQEYVDENRDNPKEASLPGVPASRAFLRQLLEGVTEHAQSLEPWVEKMCTAEWKKERMSPLMLAILRLAAFELAHFGQRKPAIIIDEYVTLAGRFFAEAETGFVNAALNAMAEEMRG